MFPARKVAIAMWILAAALVAMQQIWNPILDRDMFHSDNGLLRMLHAVATALLFPGIIGGLGAVVHLLGEIRDAIRPESKP